MLQKENNMADKELQKTSYEEIKALTKKQTTPIIFAIVGVIVINFLFTNIPRVVNTNFYDINSDELVSILINYTYYSSQSNRYEYGDATIEKGNESFAGVVDIISKYDYDVTTKTFMGIQSNYTTSGINMRLFFNYGDSYKVVSLFDSTVHVDGIAYKMDNDKVNALINEIITLSGVDEIDESEYDYSNIS